MKAYLGPWIAAPFPHWAPPTGFSGLDLRPLSQQAQQGGTPGIGLFWGEGVIADSDYLHVGDGSLYDIKPRRNFLDALPRRAGYTPKGPDLAGILLDLLTNGADPTGAECCKPLLPGVDGRIALYACGQRHYERFRESNGHWSHVRDVLRIDLRRQILDARNEAAALRSRGQNERAERVEQQYRKIVGFNLRKYRIPESRWQELVPQDMLGELDPPLSPETTITDNFNRIDANPISDSAEGWSWGVSGDVRLDSNQAVGVGTGSIARAESDLSSDDHYVQCLVVSAVASPVARYDAASHNNHYLSEPESGRLFKVVSGTFTQIGSTGTAVANGSVVKLSADGSSIELFDDAVSIVTATDSAITGNLRTGIYVPATSVRADDFEAADLGGGGLVLPALDEGMLIGGLMNMSGGLA